MKFIPVLVIQMPHRAKYLSAGRGRSLNAEQAEEEGRTPKSKAIPVLAEVLSITKVAAKQVMDTYASVHHGQEWHHVGAMAARVSFYSTNNVVAWIAKAPLDQLPPSCLRLRVQCRKWLARTKWTSWCEAGRGPGAIEQKRRGEEARVKRQLDCVRTQEAFDQAFKAWGERAEEIYGPCPGFAPEIWVEWYLQVEILKKEERSLPTPRHPNPGWFAKRFLMGPDAEREPKSLTAVSGKRTV